MNLILRHNSIRAISLHSFAGLMYLNRIDLAGNNLYQILPWTFHDNSNLQFLSLSDNPLGHVTISGPLLDIPSLEVRILWYKLSITLSLPFFLEKCMCYLGTTKLYE